MKKILQQWALLALGVLIAANTSSGIDYGDNWQTLLVVVVLLSVLNLFIRPLLVLMALPFVIMTLGIGLLFINAFLFWIIGQLVHGFEVVSMWSALWGAFVVGVTHVIAGLFLGGNHGGVKVTVKRNSGPKRNRLDDDDVIDI